MIDGGVGVLEDWIATLPSLAGAAEADSERIGQIALLEHLKSAAAAVQARITNDFVLSQRAVAVEQGRSALEADRSAAAQIALARKVAPYAGRRCLGLARALCTQLPHTLAALEAGHTTEWRATLVATATAIRTLTPTGTAYASPEPTASAGRPRPPIQCSG